MVAEQRILGAKVLGLNISEIYQYMNADLLLQGREKDIIQEYNSKYAQNISVGAAFFGDIMEGSPTFLLDMCKFLEAADCPEQSHLATKFQSGISFDILNYKCRLCILPLDYDKIVSIKKNEALQKLYPSPTTTPSLELKVSDLQSQFSQTLVAVMEAFEQLPDSLSRLKQFFSQLVLPMGEGKVVPIVTPSTYENATTTKEMIRCQSSLWNSFSPHLLKMMSEECQCLPAIEAVEQFLQFRSKYANSLICQRTKLLPKSNNTTTSLHPAHLAYHTGPLSDLQSLHPSVFESLDEDKSPEPQETMRLTVQVDRPHLTLQDYDDITTAVCGYFHIPRVALVYAGCSEDGQVICWTTSPDLLPYLKSVSSGMSADRLVAEQKIIGIAAGSLHCHCITLMVKIL